MKNNRASAFVVFGAMLLGACGGSSTSTSGEDAGVATTAPTTLISDSVEEPTTIVEPAADGQAAAETADSETDPVQFRDEIGMQIRYDCPAGGTPSTIWGVETYSDDSSVCSAAVHVGLLTFESGGEVLVEIATAQESYESGIANGIESLSFGSFGGSFIFPGAPPGSGEFDLTSKTWKVTAIGTEVGELVEVDCADGGDLRSVWGSGTYTADSSICSAGVHAGVITQADGGLVTALVVEGAESYSGSEVNGVTSREWGSYGLSFTVS